MTSVSAHTYSFGMERTYIASGVPLQGSGEYNRSAAYNYAEKYWDEVCSDSYFVDTRTTFIYLDPGTDITGMTGFDCAHFVSCCIGNELHEPGGGLDVPSTAHLIYGELGATQLGDWLIVSGNGVERAAITGLMVGDVISYDWDGDGHWDHVTLYLGGSEVAGHTTSVWAVDWQLIGAADYRFIHLLGSPWTVDDDGSADFNTIQAAINASSDGDTIFVRNGTYYEHVVVNKTLWLVGENKEAAIMNCNGTGVGFHILADDVMLTGFTIKNADWVGIHIDHANNTVVQDSILLENYDGIYLGFSNNNTITRNNVTGTLHLSLYLYQSQRNRVIANTISGSQACSFYMTTGAVDNVIYHNNINGGQAISAEANIWDNNCEGNYWSSYNGTDSNGDGIGDMPYVVDENNQDNYPLMNLYWNPGDIDHDLDIDIFDLVSCAGAYGSTPSDPNWNPHSDINEPYGFINIFDLVTIAASYGEEYTP